jgi:elongation factor P
MDIEDIHKNAKLVIDGTPYNVDDADFVKPGKGRAIYRLKLRNLVSGGTLDRTYHSSEKVEEASISTYEQQFLYSEGDQYIFMDTDTFEQHSVPESIIGDKKVFLQEGTIVTIQMFGDRPLDVQIPTFVELKVVDSDVTSRTDTISAQYKSAIMENGASVDVPTFIKPGDVIKIDTRTGSYVERINKK